MSNFQLRCVSSLEKCFYDERPSEKPATDHFTMFSNQRLSFQILYRYEAEELATLRNCPLRLTGSLAPFVKVSAVFNVPNMFPTYGQNPGGAFLRTEPGMYPDLIRPLVYPNAVSLPCNQTHAIWIDVEPCAELTAGNYELTVSVLREGTEELLGEVSCHVRVLAAQLPRQTLIHTEWFYTDCIANHYHVSAFSEAHWRYIERFLRTAVENGINMILTPLFTPELDTYIGGERLTTQLVDIERTEEGKYLFGFDKLHRWIDLCLACGVEYFEIPHFFTQWGATAAPKIIVKVKGRKRKYFGWQTDSMGAEYASFLDQFLPAVLEQFRARGLDKKCFFHISDEPKLSQLEQYRRCKELVARHLEGYPIIDALSDFDFYRTGVLEKPVPHTRGAEPFLEAKVPGLWVYYCGGGREGVSDRSISMPLARTRILGVQLYYYNIEGFLHWGYNFYNTNRSYDVIDPFGCTDGVFFTPAGDCFLVYPGTDGEAWRSLRLNALREAMDDMRALRLYEERFGREATLALILEGTDGSLTFTHYPAEADYLLALREKIAQAISADKRA